MPVVPQDITAEWLTRALGSTHPGLVVERAEIRDVLLGTSTKIRVAIDYRAGTNPEGVPSSLIVKGGFEEHSPMLAPMYLNEIRYYRDVQPLADLRTPAAYFAASDPSSHQSIVIMEDLVARDVIFCNPLRPQSYDACAWRLRDLARYHAQSWNSPEFAPGGRWDWVRNRFSTHSSVYNARYLKPDVWDHYMASPRGAAVSVTLHDRDWMEHALGRLGEIDAVSDTCLIHGDTHLGNLYVEQDGAPGFLDMQVTRSNWALEIAYHIGCSIDVADRRRWESGLLETYLGALRQEGVAAPGFDEAWLAYVRALAYGYFIFVINEVRFQTESVNTANGSRIAAAMIDHGTKALLS
nr:ecdysteroid 22-kinase family protein [Sphingobium sp. JAI105]